MPYLVMRIGCIECGVSSGVLGVFATKEEADRVAEAWSKEHDDWYEGGQARARVFELPAVTP